MGHSFISRESATTADDWEETRTDMGVIEICGIPPMRKKKAHGWGTQFHPSRVGNTGAGLLQSLRVYRHGGVYPQHVKSCPVTKPSDSALSNRCRNIPRVHYNPRWSLGQRNHAVNGVQGLNDVRESRTRSGLLLLGFSILSFLVMGYHPGLEDDGVYLAAVKSRLNPALYPHDSIFFLTQMQATGFDKLMAGFVRLTGIPVEGAELLWQLASIAAILYCCRGIARNLFKEERAQWAGVAMVGAMFTLPVAGAAIFIVDQHLHPRTMATALILAAVWSVLAGRRWQAAPILLVSFVLHPIMTLFGMSFCAILALALMAPARAWGKVRREAAQGVRVGAAAMVFIPLGWLLERPAAEWFKAVDTRGYLFLERWTWYEWLGAVAPLVLFWLLWRVASRRGDFVLARFAAAVFFFGVLHEAVAIFVWRTPALVRLTPMQPMRFLHLVYLFMALMGGCLLGKYVLKVSVWRWAAFLLVFNAGMLGAQRYQFSGSQHLELPGMRPANPWLQAFAWVRMNTPVDAYFALGPHYLAAPGEDFHSFRALAERSVLADANKDPAVVGLFPELAAEWGRQTEAQEGWAQFQLGDFERLKAEFGVSWVVVSYPPPWGLDCRWHNDEVSACRVP